MTSISRRPGAMPAHDDFGNYAFQPLHADDRIGPPIARRRRKTLLRAVVALVLMLGGGWAYLDGRGFDARLQQGQRALPGWLTTWPKSLSWPTSGSQSGAAEKDQLAAPASEPAVPPRLPSAVEIATSPGATAGEAAPVTPSSAATPDAEATEAAPAPLPPPKADPADPLQMRAMAAGLHPELSRVLLTRLSTADYRNAGVAIKTALSETPDTGVHVWPRQATAEMAIFQVRFVTGATPECRRYVVTISKDGWLTTALPMEKCRAETGTSSGK